MRLNRWTWIYFPVITELKAVIFITFRIIIVVIIAVVLSLNISFCKVLLLFQHMTVLYSESCLLTVKCFCRRRDTDSFNILQICTKMLANCFVEKFLFFWIIFLKNIDISGLESCCGCELVWTVQRNSDILQIVTFSFGYEKRFVSCECVFSVCSGGFACDAVWWPCGLSQMSFVLCWGTNREGKNGWICWYDLGILEEKLRRLLCCAAWEVSVSFCCLCVTNVHEADVLFVMHMCGRLVCPRTEQRLVRTPEHQRCFLPRSFESPRTKHEDLHPRAGSCVFCLCSPLY